MTRTRMTFHPGVVKDDTDTAAEGFYVDADNVRFARGRPELMGGFESISSDTINGICRGVHTWASNDQTKYMAFGTDTHLQTFTGGSFVDITPVETSGTLGADPLTTVISTSAVTVAHTAHGRSVGDRVSFAGATAVGGLTVAGEYTVVSVPSANDFTITDDETATSSATGGGAAIDYIYLIPVGNSDGIGGRGYGTGAYSAGEYSTPSAGVIFLRSWSMDNWGEFLVANPRGGGVYEWQLDDTTPTPAAIISNAPQQTQSIFVTPERHLVACGCENISTTFDPLLVRWSGQEDNTVWTPAATNQAGSFQLTQGSRIVRGMPAGGGRSFIWTDRALYQMTFLGDPLLVFSFDLVATGVGLIGPNAVTVKDGVAYWLSNNGQFYAYSGGTPQVITSGINRDLFENISLVQEDKIFCAQNSRFNEIWFLWPDGRLGTENNSYVVFNTLEGHWAVGTLDRTAWRDGDVWGAPVAASSGGGVFLHETGTSADGAALSGSYETSFLDIADGDAFQHIKEVVPDFQGLLGEVSLTVKHRNNPTGAVTSEAPVLFTSTTMKKNLRVTARQVSYKITSTGNPGKWRSGDLTVDVTPTGARR